MTPGIISLITLVSLVTESPLKEMTASEAAEISLRASPPLAAPDPFVSGS